MRRILRRCTAPVLLLLLLFSALPAQASGEEQRILPLPQFDYAESLQCAALGETFFCYNPAEPRFLRALNAETGEVVGLYYFAEDTRTDLFFSMKVQDQAVLVMTGRYVYRIGGDLRLQKRVEVPECPNGYDVDGALERIVYQDGIDIVLLELASGEQTTLLRGDYDTLPQSLYADPSFVADDSRLLVYYNVGAERLAPAWMDLASGELEPLGLYFDLDSDSRLVGDRLLVRRAYRTVLQDRLRDDPFWFLPAEESARLPETGYFDLVSLTFTPLPLWDESQYGLQNISAGRSFVYAFLAEPAFGWRLCYIDLSDGKSLPSKLLVEASNIELLGVSETGRVLFRSYDLQNPEKDGYAIATTL